MFAKPFRTKSNVAIKGSERKRLRSELAKQFSDDLTETDIQDIIPSKEEMSVMKLYSHKGENVFVYCLSKNPILFEHEKAIYPTVYTMWKHLSIVPLLTTQPAVIPRLLAGADLMLPGVIVPKTGLPKIRVGQAVAVHALGNMAPLAVGVALMSSRDMESAGMRGKGIKILHTFGDHLWMAGEKQQPPKIPMDELLMEDLNTEDPNEKVEDYFSNGNDAVEEDGENDKTEIGTPSTAGVDVASLEINQEEDNAEEDVAEEDERSETEIMDELLYQCFMTALKTKLKDTELPILTSTFYRTHVLACCPPGKFLDIKKSSHKKLSKYLRHVASTGLIEVKELSKGNDNLISVARSHPDLRAFQPPDLSPGPEDVADASNTVSSFGVVTQRQYEPPEMSIVHCVTAVTLPLFSSMGLRKGSPMTVPEIREAVAQYVRQHELTKTDNPRMVTLDPILHRAMYDKGGNDILSATWEDVFKKVISKLQPCHQLKFKGMAPIMKTGAPPSIKILVQQRASNKKVTIVESLESFLIDPQHFADAMRRKAQASTSLTSVPVGGTNKSSQQVLIQGNQVALVERLLTGPDYKIPKRYIKGLENAPKPKKKGR